MILIVLLNNILVQLFDHIFFEIQFENIEIIFQDYLRIFLINLHRIIFVLYQELIDKIHLAMLIFHSRNKI
jgi:hypothetical protein